MNWEDEKRPACERPLERMSTDGLFLGSLLLSEAGFDAAADVLKHALSAFGIGAGRLQFQILVKSFLCSWCGNYFACLIGSSLSYQVNSLLIIRIRFVGISGNGFPISRARASFA